MRVGARRAHRAWLSCLRRRRRVNIVARIQLLGCELAGSLEPRLEALALARRALENVRRGSQVRFVGSGGCVEA